MFLLTGTYLQTIHSVISFVLHVVSPRSLYMWAIYSQLGYK